MTQLIADVLKRDEEERLRRRNLEKQIRLGMMYYPDMPFALPDTHDDHVVYDPVDAQAGQMASMLRNPFTAWMGTPPGLDIAEFAMPTAWARAERAALMATAR